MFLPLYDGVLKAMPLHIARIYYPVLTLGPGQRVGIWTAGCNRNCKGCISPELKEENAGQAMTSAEILSIVRRIGCTPDGFTISGGEPFLQAEALCSLVEGLALITDDILIYTGFSLEELLALQNESVNRVIRRVAAIVDGPYVEEQNDGIGIRGSSNQTIHVFKHHHKYRGMDTCRRAVQTVLSGNKLLAIGIPEVER